jgi:hypothetical protein
MKGVVQAKLKLMSEPSLRRLRQNRLDYCPDQED